ncbi:galectin-3 isoform X2 [Aquarana catesbeiana]|uniref:galectin-3 isoform X2 n=1 Tax=Aquarana catesbeiana TaxID=8400 RepID=UPI003CC95824
MADEFNLTDAISGQTNAGGQQNQSQGQNWNNPWGGPGQPYPGGYPAPGPGQQFPQGGQQFPQGGQQYPGFPQGGQQYPGGFPPAGAGGFPPAGSGGFPPAGAGGFPGFPGFPAPGQQYPGAPVPGQPDPKSAGQTGPTPSAPFPSAPAGPLNLPYTLPMPSGIMPGLVLSIQGVVSNNCKRWTVDFKNGDNIVFHFNPRFDEHPKVLVRNSMLQGRWGAEERAAPKFPFQKGHPFMVKIIVEPEQYLVAVNNENLFQYKHRNRDFQLTKAVVIGGDITLNAATVGMM